MGPFHAMAEFEANSTGKDLNVTNINMKAGPSNCQIGLSINSLFLYESKRPPFEPHHQFWLCFIPPPPFTLLKITNGSLCHHYFFLNTFSLD